MPDGARLPGPVRVVRVDVDAAVPDVPARRGDGLIYEGAFVIVERAGRPIGNFEVELDAEGMFAVDLAGHIEKNLGDVWSLPAWDRPPVADEDLPFISVVIPTAFVRVDLLARCVAALGRQDYPSFEVVVVDNRPNGSAERAEHWRRLGEDSHVRVVAEPLKGIAAARNRGIAVARGEVVSFVDDDAVPERGWLRAVGRRFALEPGADAVTGLFLPNELETAAQVLFERSGSKVGHRYERVTYEGGRRRRGGTVKRGRFEVTAVRPEDPGAPPVNYLVYQAGSFGIGANMSFRAQTFARLGGFDEATGVGTPALGGEDLHYFMRLLSAGGRMTFDPEVVIYHSHARELAELQRKVYSYGCGFTANLTALVVGDPRHLVGLSTNALRALRLFGRKFFSERSAAAAQGYYPAELSRAEMRGFAAGPFRYIYSRISMRRARAAVAAAARA